VHGTILGDVIVLCQLYLDAKPSHMGVDVAGLANPLHRPMVCTHQMRGHSFLLGATMSHHTVVGSGTFLGGVPSPRPWIFDGGVDHLGISVTESYMGNPTFTRACLSYIKVIMAIMRVSLVESLC
jgi:hypothetical protein